MKKNIPILLIIGLSIVISCSKNETNKIDKTAELNADQNFNSLVTETYSFLSFLSQKIQGDSLKLQSLIQKLNNIQSSNLSFDLQLKAIDASFGVAVSDRLIYHMETYNYYWPKITTKYGQISASVLQKECEKIFNRKFIGKSNVSLRSQQAVEPNLPDNPDISRCGLGYTFCSAAVTAGAILCHAGCSTTALATTAGLGIPACVALCSTGQLYGAYECWQKYCDKATIVIPPPPTDFQPTNPIHCVRCLENNDIIF